MLLGVLALLRGGACIRGGWAAGEGRRCGILGNFLGVAKLEHKTEAIVHFCF